MKRYRRMIITYPLHQPDQEPLPELPPATTDMTISERFEAFDAENPTVYTRLHELAVEEAARGAQRISVKRLFEQLRAWGPATSNGSDPYKLDNSYTALYARRLLTDPRLSGRIETRSRLAE